MRWHLRHQFFFLLFAMLNSQFGPFKFHRFTIEIVWLWCNASMPNRLFGTQVFYFGCKLFTFMHLFQPSFFWKITWGRTVYSAHKKNWLSDLDWKFVKLEWTELAVLHNNNKKVWCRDTFMIFVKIKPILAKSFFYY